MTEMKKGPEDTKFLSGRPGQRQQERLERRERRKKRQRTFLSIFVALVLIGFAGLGLWQVQRYNSDQLAAANQRATATANTNNTNATATTNANNANMQATITAQSAQITATAQVLAGTPTPVVPSPTPPADAPQAVSGETVTLPSGLQYIDITEGVGMPAQSVYHTRVYYTGWVQETGKKFDSTHDHEGMQPFEPSPEQGLIKGWEEGVIGLKVGGTRRLIIPPALGYGDQAQGDVIPANSTLIFDITLVSLK